MNYGTAILVASSIVEMLRPHCDEITIAGSVRREVAEVGDIEIVALPKQSEHGGHCPGFVAAVISLGPRPEAKAPKPLAERRYIKVMLPWAQGVQLDIFCPQPHDYGRQVAIRTGPKEYSAKIIAGRWTKLGWVGTEHGLRRAEQCEKRGDKWVVKSSDPTMPPEFPSEEAFYSFLGYLWIPPKARRA